MKQSLVCKLCFLVCFAISSHVFSQTHFSYKATLDSVVQNGFYNISIEPSIAARCKNELDDLRIQDSSGKEIPYLLYTESARPNEESFTEFPVSYSDDHRTVYINNILPNSLDKLYLLIKNSDAQRAATLSGSDNQTNWFVIKENILLQSEYAADSDAFVQSVSFPKSSYKYLRITMPVKNVLPLNIIKAGVYRHSFTGNIYDTIPKPHIIQKDSSDKHSYIYLIFDDSYMIDRLSLSFTGSKFYKRPVDLYNQNTINPSLSSDTISSARPAGIDFHAKTNRLLFVIDNKDNAPLSVNNVIPLQLHTSVTAYLEKDKRYTLYFGDSSALAPSYDLQYFDDSIGSNILPLRTGEIEKISLVSVTAKEESGWKNWVLWGIIIAVLASLIYFSFRMMQDIKNKTGNDAHL